MEIKQNLEDTRILNAENFDLSQTFDCGQCFRWEQTGEDTFEGIAFGRKLKIYKDNADIVLKKTSKEEFNKVWKDYFDLNTNYSDIASELSNIDPILLKAYNYCPGIRILRQEPWETLCSFIISQNNNIPRIKKIIQRLCCLFGEKIEGTEEFSFPTAKAISKLKEEDLLPIKCGFRAKYILDAASKIERGEINLESISKMPLPSAEEILMKIKGVGPKVSQCTLLYGFHRLEAFPLDVWMKRIMNKYFFGKSPEIFGKYAGIAQQYLFHYCRTNSKDLFEKA